MNALHVEYLLLESLLPYAHNARTHSPKQVRQIARSIREFGFLVPILVDEGRQIIAGHGRLLAAQHLKLKKVPVVQVTHLTPAQARAYRLADNKLTELGEWDNSLLKIELQFLMSPEIAFDVDLTGFSVPEIDVALGDTSHSNPEPPPPPVPDKPMSRPGDLWVLGKHRVLCGDSRDAKAFARLMGDERARMVLSDPPYNQPAANISGLGKHQHADFAMAAGEMSQDQFVAFLKDTLGLAVAHCVDGALVYAFMDWAHLRELQDACQALGLSPINLCVWVKANGGMGSLYRSQHELIWIAKVGKAPHRNHVELGKHGRYRTNVWQYAGMNSFGAERDAALQMHPTVKSVAMLADAIRDVSDHGEIVLDPFLGSGSTLIAAEETHRRCFGLELEPKYVDVILARWQQKTREEPILAETGESWSAVRARRRKELPNEDAASEQIDETSLSLEH